MCSACLPRHPAVAYLFLVRRMNLSRHKPPSFLLVAAVATCQVVAAQDRVSRPNEPVAIIGRSASPSSRYDVPPKLLSGLTPKYPPSRLNSGEGGTAIVEFTVDEHGIPRDFSVVRTDYLYFASHAIIAMRDWRFQPAMKNGKPIAARLRIPFHYRTRFSNP
jgi:periplasmic protein TonB